MNWNHNDLHSFLGRGLSSLFVLWVGLVSAPATAWAQQTVSATALVFDGVTVIDVEHGARLPVQRVVIVANRIRAMGPVKEVPIPTGAQVIEATGKYLIPGLWDVHIHTEFETPDVSYPILLANGVTGIRDAGSTIALDTLLKWQREILAGIHVGPPRQFLSGPQIHEREDCNLKKRVLSWSLGYAICVRDESDARHVVDSLKAAGATIIKTYGISKKSVYYAIASEARRLGIPFGGHIQWGTSVTAIDASDSGAVLLDHANTSGGIDSLCLATPFTRDGNIWTPAFASVALCQPVAERLARNNTWHVPTLIAMSGYATMEKRTATMEKRAAAVLSHMERFAQAFWADSGISSHADNWLHGPVNADTLNMPSPDSIGSMRIAQQVSLPIMTGSDAAPEAMDTHPPGFVLHAEMTMLVLEGLTPLHALQAATLNPAKAFKMTDSLGTVAVGKLADLILLDADPLVDITNTTTIRAVVANGRYFDRAALDQVLADARKAR